MRLDFTFQRILLNGCFWWTTRDQWLQTLASSNSGDESQNIKSWCWRLFLGIGIVQWLCFSRSTTGKQFRNKVTRNQSLKCWLLQDCILIIFKSFVGLWSSIRKVIGKNPLECKVKSHFEETCKSQNSQFMVPVFILRFLHVMWTWEPRWKASWKSWILEVSLQKNLFNHISLETHKRVVLYKT